MTNNNPLRTLFSRDDSGHKSFPDLLVTLCLDDDSVVMTHDGFLIGSSHRCDLKLNSHTVSPVHAVIHQQQGAIWVEAASDEQILMVNQQRCRRMTLRHTDQLQIGSVVLTIKLEIVAAADFLYPTHVSEGDGLASLSAAELCEQILLEQSRITELSQSESRGWEGLLSAIESVHQERLVSADNKQASAVSWVPHSVSNEALAQQIHEIQASLAERTKELSQLTTETMFASAQLHESQQRALQRLNEILDQLTNIEEPHRFRASA